MARSRWNVYLRLGRVSNLSTVWTNCLAGTLLACGGFDPIVFAPAVVATSMFYVAGMFLNDAFDRDFDSQYWPEHPVADPATVARLTSKLPQASLSA